jgi:hypothetical protein
MYLLSCRSQVVAWTEGCLFSGMDPLHASHVVDQNLSADTFSECYISPVVFISRKLFYK